ncbi:META domain-containing protein [Psychrobacter sp. FDAARGOS_221]|uniref:META domain-containing protein n=1 Tax=Psychrobacter sp. FDAARGOS_221 TaxID=1975705 RepID=UPI000BB594C2|nr:META domain-containing protein [Psychrobacter sp. FDAARGOS_221]PNK60871.1 META domain-containing protein [Psychrobacter sp. FDAARGOS_221]
MKILNPLMLTATLTVAALAAGCQTTTTTSVSHPKITTYPMDNTVLQAYNWQLVDAKMNSGEKVNALFIDPAKPLTLNFMQADGNNMVSFMNTCNNMSANYRIENDSVTLGNVMSTMMACPDPEAQFDAAAMKAVVGKYTLSQSTNKVPMLVITNDNQVSHFQAVPKAQ